MHRCLNVPELISEIFSWLENPESDRSDAAALAALAATCRAFYEPALNDLWYSLPCLSFLIKCMPTDLWDESDSRKLTFRRKPLADDWARFLHHSCRVRRLAVGDSYVRTHPSVYISMIRQQPTGRLFPRLLALKWSEPHNTAFMIPTILTPLVEDLHWVLWSEAWEYASDVLDLIPMACPLLQDVTITWCTWAALANTADEVSEALSSLVFRLPLVCHLNIGTPLRPGAVVHIASQASLTSLTMMLARDVHFLPFPPNAFPSLVSLNLEDSEGNDSFLPIIESISSAVLRELNLTCSNGNQLYPLLSAISRRPFITALESINLMFEEDIQMDIAAVEPLLAGRSLKIVRFTHVCFEDSTLEAMAAAWPRLQELEVVIFGSKITLEGILALLRHCPYLKSLHNCHINIAGVTLDPARWPREITANCRIHTLTVGDSVIDDPHATAAFLSRFLPSVRRFITFDDVVDYLSPGEGTRQHQLINETLRIMETAREASMELDEGGGDADIDETQSVVE